VTTPPHLATATKKRKKNAMFRVSEIIKAGTGIFLFSLDLMIIMRIMMMLRIIIMGIMMESSDGADSNAMLIPLSSNAGT